MNSALNTICPQCEVYMGFLSNKKYCHCPCTHIPTSFWTSLPQAPLFPNYPFSFPLIPSPSIPMAPVPLPLHFLLFPSLSDFASVRWYSCTLLGEKEHSESKLSCPRKQHNDLAKSTMCPSAPECGTLDAKPTRYWRQCADTLPLCLLFQLQLNEENESLLMDRNRS